MSIRTFAVVALAVLLAACASATPTPLPTRVPTITPSPTPEPAPTSTPAPRGVHVDPMLPADLIARVNDAIAAAPNEFTAEAAPSAAGLRIGYSPPVGLPVLGRRVFALVAAFPTIADAATWAEVEAAWNGAPDHGPLRMTQATYAALGARYGEAAPGAVEVLGADQIVDALWASRAAWGIVPFDELDPRLKVLYVEGRSPLRRELDLNQYPLAVDVVLSGDLNAAAAFQSAFGQPYTNRDESRMTVLGLTGVTALTRDIGLVMDREGVLFPAEQIRPWLEEVDILHISNEVSFTPDCQILTGTVVFCSRPAYFDLLTSIGADVVENTGNHMNDWGREPFSNTLDLFRQADIPYYGGGYNLIDAARPVTIEDHGNLIGFVGCNPNGPDIAWATETLPGSYPCREGGGMDFTKVQPQIEALRAQGALPVFTIQYWEFYTYEPSYQQAAEFRKAAELGAAIVSGSQAHHPQGFDFHNGAVIHWGLGNLFFDQSASAGQRQGLLDRYVIYDNRVLSLEPLTFIRENYAQPRPLTPQERAGLLSALFAASGW
jgi:poly-gamma-glutamate synthesis protein (capsule biosynthesis protein)